jgi:hypothetical protein
MADKLIKDQLFHDLRHFNERKNIEKHFVVIFMQRLLVYLLKRNKITISCCKIYNENCGLKIDNALLKNSQRNSDCFNVFSFDVRVVHYFDENLLVGWMDYRFLGKKKS